jgi:hypothetical protein
VDQIDQIDQELTSLLSLEPSPEFRARVRARIASEPLPSPWYLQWRVAAAAAAAALTVVAGVAIMRVAPAPQPRPAALGMENGPAVTARPADPAPAQRAPVAVVVARRAAPRATSPEVLIDASAGRGLRQLDALVREGRTRFVFADESVVQQPVRDIVVAPIVVEPIAVTTLSEPAGDVEGDRQ